MAERRMFAKTIVLSDAFLNLPMSARCLYFTLSMLADDDGFVNAPRSIMRQCGASEDDMGILAAKKFVIIFTDGILVIKHWRINNYLRSDRYTETKYTDKKKALVVDDNGSYHIAASAEISQSGIPGGIPSIDKDSIDKDSIDKDSVDKDSIDKDSVENIYIAQKSPDDEANEKRFSEFWEAYGNKKGKKNAFKAFSKIRPDEELFQQIMSAIEKYHQSRKWRDGYRKEPATWLNGECWNDEYDDESEVNPNGIPGRNDRPKGSGNRKSAGAPNLKPRFVGHIYDADGNDITPGI